MTLGTLEISVPFLFGTIPAFGARPPYERLHGRTTSFDHRASGRAIPTETDFSIVVQFRKSEDPNRRCDSPDFH
jgi:hypothetical protein